VGLAEATAQPVASVAASHLAAESPDAQVAWPIDYHAVMD
jgi:hypothetical protein